jgi:hypothetical protein
VFCFPFHDEHVMEIIKVKLCIVNIVKEWINFKLRYVLCFVLILLYHLNIYVIIAVLMSFNSWTSIHFSLFVGFRFLTLQISFLSVGFRFLTWQISFHFVGFHFLTLRYSFQKSKYGIFLDIGKILEMGVHESSVWYGRI